MENYGAVQSPSRGSWRPGSSRWSAVCVVTLVAASCAAMTTWLAHTVVRAQDSGAVRPFGLEQHLGLGLLGGGSVVAPQLQKQAWLRGMLQQDGKNKARVAAAPTTIPDGKVPGYLSRALQDKLVSEYARAVSGRKDGAGARRDWFAAAVRRVSARTGEGAASPLSLSHHAQASVPALQPRAPSARGATEGEGLPWHDAMGTDISFIKTSTFPESMANGGHTRHTVVSRPAGASLQGRRRQPQPQQTQGGKGEGRRERVSSAKPAAVGFHKWSAPMGTDISFINTLDFPGSMVGAEHARHSSPGTGEGAAATSTNVASAATHPVAHQPPPAGRAGGAVGSREAAGAAKGKMLVARTASQLSLGDYGLTGDDELRIERPADPAENQNWTHPEYRGSPCSVGGNCNHGSMHLNDPGAVRERFLERYFAQGEDGNGHSVDNEEGGGGKESEDGQDNVEDAEASKEAAGADEEEGAAEGPRLGSNLLMGGMDDFVTPDDAYAHNELTSGADGYDHFAHLPPGSLQNKRMLYGAAFAGNGSLSSKDVLGIDARVSPTRGALIGNALGDHQVGGSDVEVNATDAWPRVPGLERDALGGTSPSADANQRLVNGRYYLLLRRDGVLDRETPVDEARAQMVGASHDRQPLPDLAFGDWNIGFGGSGRGQAWERAREEAHGEDWREKVNTGTHEQIERGLGVARNMEKDGAYFKQRGKAIVLHDTISSDTIRF